jgi:hypothetical protein
VRRSKLEEQARRIVQYSYEVEGKTPPEGSDLDGSGDARET